MEDSFFSAFLTERRSRAHAGTITALTKVLLDRCTLLLTPLETLAWAMEKITPFLLQFVTSKRRYHEIAAGYSMFCQVDFVAKLSSRLRAEM